MRRLKGDNKGFSLIEVLIAVVILAIVVTPFLRSFVTAATTNSKAKSIHKATVLAQSVMEGFKAEELEEISAQFDNPEEGFYVVPSGLIGEGAGVESLVGELHYADQPDGVFYYYLQEVQEDSTKYDVLVKLDATAYQAGNANSVEAAHQYNEVELAQLPVIDLEQDGICVQKQAYTDYAAEEFMASHITGDEAVIRDSMRRTITVSVDKVMLGTEYKITVSAEYKYSYTPEDSAIPYEYKKNQLCYDSTETEKDLRSVYLYYYPLYQTSEASARDEIVFENNAQIPVNFYLMKQKSDSATTTTEAQYDLKFTIAEQGVDDVEDMQTTLYTNLANNLAEEGTPIGTPFYTVFLNNNMVDLNTIASSGMLLIEEEDRVFDIEVSIYESGAKDAGFPEDERLTTLTGSRLN